MGVKTWPESMSTQKYKGVAIKKMIHSKCKQ